MMNLNLASQIKEARYLKGMSQEQLAENSKLSLRTIQRVEKGQSVPRGDTLLKLISALDLKQEEIITSAKSQENVYFGFLNLIALSFLVYSIVSIILPIMVLVYNVKRNKMISMVAKNILVTQIILVLGMYICLYLFADGRHLLHGFDVVDFRFSAFRQMSLPLTVSIGALYAINILNVLYNIFRNLKGLKSKYFFIF